MSGLAPAGEAREDAVSGTHASRPADGDQRACRDDDALRARLQGALRDLAVYRALYRYAPVPYLTLTREGRVTRANRNALRILGGHSDVVVGGGLVDWAHANDRDELRRFIDAAYSSPPEATCEVALGSGAAPWSRVRVRLVEDEVGPVEVLGAERAFVLERPQGAANAEQRRAPQEVLLLTPEGGGLADALDARDRHLTVVHDMRRFWTALEAARFHHVVVDRGTGDFDEVAVARHLGHSAPETTLLRLGPSVDVEAVRAALLRSAANTSVHGSAHGSAEAGVATAGIVTTLGTERAEAPSGAPAIFGSAPAIVALREQVGLVARSTASVLVQGESGTGKELVARALHAGSPRCDGPFVAVHCAALPEGLIEAELFGHEKGAFTGAVGRRRGRFEQADGGTLLLDEIGEISAALQAKLLRVLQERIVQPLGGNALVPVDVRVVCATHRDLRAMVAEGSFREDLYYRLKVLDVTVPPLRARRVDIPRLLEHFTRKFGAAIPRFTLRAWAALNAYDYPGNVRELEHAAEHAVVLAAGADIDIEHLPVEIRAGLEPALGDAGADEDLTLAAATQAFERNILLQALERSGGRKAAAAAALGISRKCLWEKLRQQGIATPPRGRRGG